MHFFDFTPPSAPARLVRLAVCTLLPAFIQEAVAGGMQRPSFGRSSAVHLPPPVPPAPVPQSSPYLLVCLPPPLRFAEPVEPADPVSGLPTALGPPHPAGLLEEIAALNQQAAMAAPSAAVAPAASSAGSPAIPVAATPAPSPSSAPAAADPAAPVAGPAAAPPQTGISILPDDTPRAIRAEDVLVYFQFPAASPSNGLPPRSSATYRQQ